MYNLQEKFSYDNFNQLQSATGPTSFSITYGADGNINQKTGVGDYTYIANKHAIENLKNYPVPEPVSTHKQDITYTAFNKASQITEGDYEYNIAYAADDERFKTELLNTQTNTTEQIKYYAGDYEEFRDASNNVMRRLHYINSPYGLVAVVEKTGTNYDVRYVMTDYIGSICAVTDDAGNVLQQVSFDAWGRRRDPQTWALYGVTNASPSALYFGRGYTGHEHLEKFDLINMNGRMYDPTLCRMLSVDNYNNNVSSTIGMNRYAYALNNPLKYTDPTGNFAVVDSWSVGFVHGFFSTGSGRWSAGWNEANLRAGNDAKIWVGLFVSDPNKSFGGRVWETVSRFTWQAPQTVGGFLTAQAYNTFGLGGGVESVNYKYGATVVKMRGEWGGITQGSYIVGDNSIEADPNNPLFQHEYGHYLQSQSMGYVYYGRVGISSILSKGDHDFHPVEQDANRRAFLYFNKNVDGFQDDAILNDNKGWNFNYNPLDVNKSGQGIYIDYQNANSVSLLNNLRVRAKWYDYVFPIVSGFYNAYQYNH